MSNWVNNGILWKFNYFAHWLLDLIDTETHIWPTEDMRIPPKAMIDI